MPPDPLVVHAYSTRNLPHVVESEVCYGPDVLKPHDFLELLILQKRLRESILVLTN